MDVVSPGLGVKIQIAGEGTGHRHFSGYFLTIASLHFHQWRGTGFCTARELSEIEFTRPRLLPQREYVSLPKNRSVLKRAIEICAALIGFFLLLLQRCTLDKTSARRT